MGLSIRQVGFGKAVAAMQKVTLTIGFLASVWLLSAPAGAETIALTCTPHDVGAPTDAAAGALTLSYAGEAAGVLTVNGPLGEMALPATKETREGVVEGVNDGKPYTVTGIRGSGPVVVLMPDKSAIEACVTDKLKPDGAADADLAFMAVLSCTGAAAQGANPVPVIASVEIALTSTAPGQWEILTVYMKRTFAEPSKLPGGKITIESDPRCEIGKN